jgi:S1-C subfamily serine protease
MEQDGNLDPPTLGVETAPLSPGLAQLLGLTVEHGLLVRSVASGGPAQAAGVRPLRRGGRTGDVIVTVAGRSVREPGDLATVLRDQQAGRRVTVEVMRGAAARRLRVTLAPR